MSNYPTHHQSAAVSLFWFSADKQINPKFTAQILNDPLPDFAQTLPEVTLISSLLSKQKNKTSRLHINLLAVLTSRYHPGSHSHSVSPFLEIKRQNSALPVFRSAKVRYLFPFDCHKTAPAAPLNVIFTIPHEFDTAFCAWVVKFVTKDDRVY